MQKATQNGPRTSACSVNPVEQMLAAWFDTGRMFNARAIRARAGILNVIIGVTMAGALGLEVPAAV